MENSCDVEQLIFGVALAGLVLGGMAGFFIGYKKAIKETELGNKLWTESSAKKSDVRELQ